MIDVLSRDLHYASRSLRKTPVFACIAMLTLALGIGANTAIFSVIYAVLLKPLNYPDPGRLVQITGGATPARFDQLRSASKTFTGMAAYATGENLTLITDAQPAVLNAARVSAGFLSVLGVYPLLGRDFTQQEDSPAGPPVIMISADVWEKRFDGDLHVLGRTMMLASGPQTIVAVLPPNFAFPSPRLDAWLPRPQELTSMPPKSRPISPFLTIFGRLRAGVTIDEANAELAVLQRQYATSHPALLDIKPESPRLAVPLKEQLVADIHNVLWMLFGAVGFVLLIACANVASLLLARASARSHEFVLRAALGAGRGRLISQVLAESVLLSLGGGAIGLLLAVIALRAIRTITTIDLPRAGEIAMNPVVLAFALVVSLATGILFGLAPSINASRLDLIASLRTRAESTVGSVAVRRGSLGLSTRGLLVIGQIALSVVLLIGAALLVQSVARLRADNVGFNPNNLLTMRVSLPLSRYNTDQKKRSFFQDLVSRMEAVPGIRGAAVAMALPMTGVPGTPVQDTSKPIRKLNERRIATVNVVSSHYFQTLQIPLQRGRFFDERDRESTQRVAVIDDAFARYFWPGYPHGVDPIGQHILVGGTNPVPAEIVGVVGKVHENIENSVWPEGVYLCLAQGTPPTSMVVARTAGDPKHYVESVRRQVQALDRDQPVSDVQSMTDLVEAQLGRRQLLVDLLGAFSALALVLAMVGIYGVIAYSVAQRTYEMGIRKALGAREFDILLLIVAQVFGLALAGISVGLGGAFALTRVMKKMLFHVSTTDPLTFVAVALGFLLIAVAAAYLPARRAIRLDPMAAFRYQ
jgi:predicted permease